MTLISFSRLPPYSKSITSNPYFKMAERIIHNDCLIMKFSSTDYQAFVLNADDDVEDERFSTLSEAELWIDKNNVNNGI